MSEFFDNAFNAFGRSSADPIRLDPSATQAWRDATPLPDLTSAQSTVAQAASKAGISGASPASGSPAGQPTPVVTPSTGGIAASGVGAYIVRGVVIVLGFVFVGVGLTMFKPQSILEKVTR